MPFLDRLLLSSGKLAASKLSNRSIFRAARKAPNEIFNTLSNFAFPLNFARGRPFRIFAAELSAVLAGIDNRASIMRSEGFTVPLLGIIQTREIGRIKV